MHKNTFLYAGLVAVPLVLCGFQKALPPAVQVQQLNAVLNVKVLTTAMNMYAADADDIYPNVMNLNSLKVTIQPYVKDKKAWKTENPKSEIRFNYAVGGLTTKSIEHPEKVVMFYESKNWPDRRRAVSFVDGTARLLTPHEWAEASSSLLLDIPRAAKPLPESTGKAWKN